MSFDRASSFYDATRAVPPMNLEQLVDGIVAATHAGHDTRFLELGVGSGRIALPLLWRGYEVTGVDISEPMMDLLRQRARPEDRLTLIHADLLHLPFEDASFDVAYFVHVLHLIPEWRQALQEARRVLKPDGWLVIGDDHGAPGSLTDEVRKQWRVFMREEGTPPHPHHGTWERVQTELTDLGGWTSIYLATRWQVEVRPEDYLETLRRRTHSEAWDLPQKPLDRTHERLMAWASERFGPPDVPISTTWEVELSATSFE